jgi:hypothetical protein
MKDKKRNSGKDRMILIKQIDAAKFSLDIVDDRALLCSLDHKCSRFIQERLRLGVGVQEQERFFEKLLRGTHSNFDQLVTD